MGEKIILKKARYFIFTTISGVAKSRYKFACRDAGGGRSRLYKLKGKSYNHNAGLTLGNQIWKIAVIIC
ncbi:MAG: hypothetical protein WBA41_12960 [Rivularia sp. (in: cyanobacteria)]